LGLIARQYIRQHGAPLLSGHESNSGNWLASSTVPRSVPTTVGWATPEKPAVAPSPGRSGRKPTAPADSRRRSPLRFLRPAPRQSRAPLLEGVSRGRPRCASVRAGLRVTLRERRPGLG
jgi:hypothetical protein